MTRGELGTLLLSDTTRLDEPVLLALGRGRIMAPLRVADCYVQGLPTAASAALSLGLETTRVAPAPRKPVR